ncbi:MAG: transcription termination factor Rho, partial [Calditrichaeota bacterium]|nr:transcription termination factor Rho [Calditrichota bacterium]
RRDLPGAEVFHSSSDMDVENHLRITALTMNMATRRMECGADVLVLIDSLTRMGRAFNKDSDSGGKTLSGGLSANALELPRRFFGAARNLEHGGSLTIMATILVDTGSRMDEVIFQEFKGTGNLDLALSRECADRRLFPAINIRESGTRKEHKLLPEKMLDQSNMLRRKTAGMNPPEALQYLLEHLPMELQG